MVTDYREGDPLPGNDHLQPERRDEDAARGGKRLLSYKSLQIYGGVPAATTPPRPSSSRILK